MGTNYTYYSTDTGGRLVLIYCASYFTGPHLVVRINLNWSFKLSRQGKGDRERTGKAITDSHRFLAFFCFLIGVTFLGWLC